MQTRWILNAALAAVFCAAFGSNAVAADSSRPDFVGDALLFLYLAALTGFWIFIAVVIAHGNSIPLRELPGQLKFTLTMFHGRINRSQWWAFMALNCATFYVSDIISYFFVHEFLRPSQIREYIDVVVFWPPFIWQAAFVVRRLHDRNKSWWWMIFWFPPLFVLTFYVGGELLSAFSERVPPQEPGGIAVLVSLILVLWMLIELGFLPSTQGNNKYGPEPQLWAQQPDHRHA